MLRSIVFTGLLLCLFQGNATTLCNGDPRAKSACNGWRSLQQLRTLIPDRMWQEEFTVKVDRRAFKKAAESWKTKKNMIASCENISQDRNFYIRSTFSGENIRMLDHYQEFLATPFWNYPSAVESLHEMQNKGK